MAILRMTICSAALLAFGSAARGDEALDHGAVYAFVRLTTDYRISGVSSSDRQPALQGSLHWVGPSRYYVGAWASTVDFDDPHDTSFEFDLYAGRRFGSGDLSASAEVFVYTTPDNTGPDPDYDYFETRVQGSARRTRAALRALLGWSPSYAYGAGEASRVELAADYRPTESVTLTAIAGHRWLERRIDRSFWELGARLHRRRWAFDIRYVDTDLRIEDCGYTQWCEPAITAAVTFHLRSGR